MAEKDTVKAFEDWFGFTGATSRVTALKSPKPKKVPKPVVVEPEPEPEPEPVVVLPTKPPEVVESHPLDFLDCGHLDFKGDHEGARAAGFCCAAGKDKMVRNYRYMVGKYRRPIPKGARRSLEKVDQGGFPGYCTDEEGCYIGGTYNDCRRVEGGPLCKAHQKTK